MKYRFVKAISDIDPAAWNALRRDRYPFLAHEFLSALETSQCVAPDTGWTPLHLVGELGNNIVLAMPLYIKTHSYGEYVFDWQWAQAFEGQGGDYYPKLLSAIPFTPATGPRILSREPLNEDVLCNLKGFVSEFAKNNQLSSWHLLFPEDNLSRMFLEQEALLFRQDVQFHWFNKGFANFDDFLAPFRSSKRKQIRRERRKVKEQGIQLTQKVGRSLTDEDWEAFYRCYRATYLKRSGHSGYLSEEFFSQIAEALADQIMIAFANIDGEVIASSLFFFDDETLYGRYWGAITEFDCLHFEACYYQGIDFAIEQGLAKFDPGTQGEHKLVRGFEPTKTCSFHWIKDPDFAAAIQRYLDSERKHTDRYQKAAADCLPFHKDSS